MLIHRILSVAVAVLAAAAITLAAAGAASASLRHLGVHAAAVGTGSTPTHVLASRWFY